MKRAVHFDFHTLPGIHDIAVNWDAEKFAKTLKNANVEIINATAQCNIGNAYFPTKIGNMYPGLKVDLFGEIVSACRKEGIRVVGYISTLLNHEECNRHPEWCRVNKEGQIIYGDRTANFFRSLCVNTGYSDHFIGLLKEILAYDPDGLFLDNVVTNPPCYCPVCTKKMQEAGIDIDDAMAVSKFTYHSVREFVKRVRAVVPMDKSLITNGFGETIGRTHGEIECLPNGGWGYDYFPTAIAYARNVYENSIYMTGRFQRSWGDFGGYRPRASLENDFYDALVYNTQVSVGDHLDPKGELYQPFYDMIGDIFSRLKEYEKWTDDAEYIKEVAILKNTCPFYPFEDKLAWDAAARMCGELKYNFDVINEDMDFEPYKVIIVPDLIRMTDKLKSKLEEFLKDDTKAVLATGTSLLDENSNYIDSDCWNFVNYEGKDETKTGYYRMNESDLITSMYEDGLFIKPDRDYSLATYVKPYFDRHWDGLHGYFYTPPECETEFSAVCRKDNFMYVSFKMFIAFYKYGYMEHRDLLEGFLKKYIKEPLLIADELPKTSRASVTGTDDYKLLHVKTTFPEVSGHTCVIQEHMVLPAGRKVKVKGNFKKAVLLPCETEIPSVSDGIYTEVTLPEINGYAMIKLD